MISAPPQGFLASALMDSAVDGTTLVVSGGRAAVNLDNANTWQASQTFSSPTTLDAGTGTAGGSGDAAIAAYVGGNLNGATTFSRDEAFIGTNLSAGGAEIDLIANDPGSGWALQVYKLTGSAAPYGLSPMLFGVDSSGNISAMAAAGQTDEGIIRAPNWNGSNWGLQIGANASGVAAIMANAPSGFANWIEQLMVAGSLKWHIDASGNAVAAGTVSGANLSAPNWSSATPNYTTVTAYYQDTTLNSTLSSGIGVSVTCLGDHVLVTGNITFVFNGGAYAALFRSTAGIPAAGSAVPSGDVLVMNITSNLMPSFVDSGLTPGTVYYYYLGAIVGGSTGESATIASNASTGAWAEYIMAKPI